VPCTIIESGGGFIYVTVGSGDLLATVRTSASGCKRSTRVLPNASVQRALRAREYAFEHQELPGPHSSASVRGIRGYPGVEFELRGQDPLDRSEP
jgi:hypothetical protein